MNQVISSPTIKLTGARFLRVRVQRFVGRLYVVAKPDIVPFSTCNLGSPTPLLKWWGRQQRATDPRSGGIEDN